MAKNAKQMQKQRQKSAARRTQKRAQVVQDLRRQSSIANLSQWDFSSCLISSDWTNVSRTNLVSIFVVRISKMGALAGAAFLIDLGCMGIKNSQFFSRSTGDQLERFRQGLNQHHHMVPCAPELALKIIDTAVQYAQNLGFPPPEDFAQHRRILDGVDASLCTESIPTGGPNGIPFFVAGPYDEHQEIVLHLTRRLGPDGFDFVLPPDMAFDEG